MPRHGQPALLEDQRHNVQVEVTYAKDGAVRVEEDGRREVEADLVEVLFCVAPVLEEVVDGVDGAER